jgi:hypothetical protein
MDESDYRDESEKSNKSKKKRFENREEYRQRPWRDRMSVRELLVAQRTSSMERLRQLEDDDEIPTPEGTYSDVNLSGFVLAEVFTPSRASALERALERLPMDSERERSERVQALKKNRTSNTFGAWWSLGTIVPRSAGRFSTEAEDPSLPPHVTAVHLGLHYVTPSISVVVATFALDDDFGNMGDVVGIEFKPELGRTDFRISGRLGALRKRIPWARPKVYNLNTQLWSPRIKRHKAFFDFVESAEEDCWKWFRKIFEGKFSDSKKSERPSIRLFLGKEESPFENGSNRHWLSIISELDWQIWQKKGSENSWRIKRADWIRNIRKPYWVAAARRSDIARPGYIDADEKNSTLSYVFGQESGSLMVQLVLTNLLSRYSIKAMELRDRAALRKPFYGTVRKAQELDDFLLRDGLDAVSVIADIEKAADEDHSPFFMGTKYVSESSPRKASEDDEDDHLANWLWKSVSERAVKLGREIELVTANVRSSADLQHTISDTILQRIVFVIGIVALVIAIVAL